MSKTLKEPGSIVGVDELADGDSSFFNRLETVNVENLLLERSVEAFDDTVALRTSNKGRGKLQSKKKHLLPEVI
jgi:hypothetical protein